MRARAGNEIRDNGRITEGGMTTTHIGDSGSPTPRGAYHNSGWGPREVLRTTAIGKTVLFDVGETLRLWRPTAEDKSIRGKLDTRKVTLLSPEIIDRACDVTLDLLGVAPIEKDSVGNPSRHALKSLAVLTGEVMRAGAVENLVGIARALPGASRDIALGIVKQDVDTLPALQV